MLGCLSGFSWDVAVDHMSTRVDIRYQNLEGPFACLDERASIGRALAIEGSADYGVSVL